MNLEDLHKESDKEVSAAKLFTSDKGIVTAIQLKKDGILKEHITKIPALLLCISGKTIYEEENQKIELLPGDYVNIRPFVNHWLTAGEDSQLILIR